MRVCLQIHQYLDDMAAVCGAECSTESIGESYEGRDLYILKVGRPHGTKYGVTDSARGVARRIERAVHFCFDSCISSFFAVLLLVEFFCCVVVVVIV